MAFGNTQTQENPAYATVEGGIEKKSNNALICNGVYIFTSVFLHSHNGNCWYVNVSERILLCRIFFTITFREQHVYVRIVHTKESASESVLIAVLCIASIFCILNTLASWRIIMNFWDGIVQALLYISQTECSQTNPILPWISALFFVFPTVRIYAIYIYYTLK